MGRRGAQGGEETCSACNAKGLISGRDWREAGGGQQEAAAKPGEMQQSA